MSLTKKDIKNWLERGIQKRANYMIVCSDNFSYEYYPVFVSSKKELDDRMEKIKSNKNMTSIKEVYSYKKSFDSQLDEKITWSVE